MTVKKRRARSFVLLPLFLVFLYPGACSEQSSQNTEGTAKRVEVDLGDGSFSFLLPEGFHELTGKEGTTTRWSSLNGPHYAFSIEGAHLVIVIVLTDILAEEFGSDEYLSGFLSGMAERFSSTRPGYAELTREVREINGVNWGRLESQSHKGDSEIRLDNYVTCLGGRILMVNLSATTDLYAEYQQDLNAAIESFELRGRC